MDPLTKENIIRKKIAKNPTKAEDWAALLGVLIGQLNFKEVEFIAHRALELNPNSYVLKMLCLNALLNSINFEPALKLLEDEGFCNFLKVNRSAISSMYYLDMIGRATGSFNLRFPDLRCNNEQIQSYNTWLFSSGSTSQIDVVFYLAKPFHYPIQARVANLVKAAGYRCIFTEHLWAAIALSPRVIVTSEVFPSFLPLLRARLPHTVLVNTRHGLADKNYLAVGASNADKICVSSDSVARFFKDKLLIDESKIWVTGFPLLDKLFNSPSKVKREKNGVVLFAPTFNPGLGCLDLLKGKDLIKLIRGDKVDVKIIIRPHPSTANYYPELIRQWENESKIYPNVVFENNSTIDMADLFNQSDVMISDLSSIALSWVATEKPLIMILNDQQSAKSVRYAEEGIEHQIASAATIVEKLDDLNAKVLYWLSHPQDKRQKMDKYTNFLFGNLRDGKASERVAAKIVQLLPNTSPNAT